LIGASRWKGEVEEARHQGLGRRWLNRERKGKEGAQRKKKGPDGWGHPVSVRRKKKMEDDEPGCCGRGVAVQWAGRAER
jgi:hypothetical protein